MAPRAGAAAAAARMAPRLLPGGTCGPLRFGVLDTGFVHGEARARLDVDELRHGLHRPDVSADRLPYDLDGRCRHADRRDDRVPVRLLHGPARAAPCAHGSLRPRAAAPLVEL